MNSLLMEIISPTVRISFEAVNGEMACVILSYHYGSLDRMVTGTGETAELALAAAHEKWKEK